MGLSAPWLTSPVTWATFTREELQVLFNQGYAVDSTLGKSGVEKQYEDELRGVDGIGHRTVDVRERAVSEIWQTAAAPQPGRDVVLTIDWDLQRAAQEALGPRVGSVVVLQPATGSDPGDGIVSMVRSADLHRRWRRRGVPRPDRGYFVSLRQPCHPLRLCACQRVQDSDDNRNRGGRNLQPQLQGFNARGTWCSGIGSSRTG